MKVLHVLYQSLPNTSGSSIRSRDILNNQLKVGLKPIVITSPFQNSYKRNSSIEEIDGVKYYRTFSNSNEIVNESKSSFFLQIKKFFRIFAFSAAVYRVAKTEKVDIIHAHAMFFCAISAKVTSFLLNKPLIYEIRSLWEERYKKYNFFSYLIFSCITFIETLSMLMADHLIAINVNLKNELQKRLLLKNKKILIIENAVDLDKVKYLECNRRELVFGYIGTLSPIEGLDLLIEVFNNLKTKNKLLIFGDGIELEKLKKLANKNSNIEFKGKVSNNDIAYAYKQIDVIINPRISNYLTNSVTPLKTLEAMAYKKLVLASDVGGMKELIRDGENGILFKSDSIDELKNIIFQIFKRKDLPKIIENGHDFVFKNRNWLENAKLYSTLYEKLNNEKSN